MKNKALIVGIDAYRRAPLMSCVSDASSVAKHIAKHEDGSPNFDVKLLVSDGEAVTRRKITDQLAKLFGEPGDTAFFYFAGHGRLDDKAPNGFLITQEGEEDGWGVSLADLLALANRSPVRSKILVLDCCASGAAGEIAAFPDSNTSVLGTGVTILTACDRHQSALSGLPHSVFASLFIDAIAGAAADICGLVTPASIYSHIDQALGWWSQRPLYKANVRESVTLRRVAPKVPLEVLRRLPEYFGSPQDDFKLNPTFEPEAELPKDLSLDDAILTKRRATFFDLQRCNRNGLIVPVGAEHMFHAAVRSKACKLTPLGRHFHALALAGRL